MIIHTLALHNFMSYSDAKLDLTPVAIACLTGSNGAGKSALLDAITWVLWEEARASSDELIRLGESEMWVDICFSLEGQIYRVRRARQKSYGKAGQQISSRGQLDLQVWTGDEDSWMAHHRSGKNGDSSSAGGWRSLTANHMRETQKSLRELMHMDFETFISSVYLRQGRADEFTTRSPNERKQVFADILGLDYFDRLQERCKLEIKQSKGKMQILEASLLAHSEMDAEFGDSIKEVEQLKSELKSIEEQLGISIDQINRCNSDLAQHEILLAKQESATERGVQLREDLKILDATLDDLIRKSVRYSGLLQSADLVMAQFADFERTKEEAEALDLKANAYHELNSKKLELHSRLAMLQGRLEVELDHLGANLESKEARTKVLSKSCRDIPKLEQQFAEFKKLSDTELEMSKKRETFTALNTRAAELQSMIGEARVRLESQVQQKEGLLQELDELLKARDSIEYEQESLKFELKQIEQAEVEFEYVEEKGLKVKSQVENLQQQIQILQKHIKENEERVHELCQAPDLSSCPLCKSPIVDSKAVIDRYEQDSKHTVSEIDSIELKINELTDERDSLRRVYIELRKKLVERKNIDMRIGEFNERQQAIERAHLHRDAIQSDLLKAKESLENNTFSPVEKESLIRVRAELAKLEFDPIVFASVQAQMRSQRHIEVRYQQGQRELLELNQLQNEIPLAQEKIDEIRESLKNSTFGGTERAEIEQLMKRMSDLSYEREHHQEVKQRLADLLPVLEKAREVRNAKEELPQVEKQIAELIARVQSKNSELNLLEQQLFDWSRKLEEMPQKKLDLELEIGIRDDLLSKKEECTKRKMFIDLQIKQLKKDKLEFDEKKKLLEDCAREISEYSMLAEAFGKKGIQAIIIENALPEIEAESNRLLSRLSDNRMHLSLLTQTKTRQGNTVETLDILIADELGTRSYELYSGGEAFKVNFALRIAMSRLLARRAGARLETLIIDEGFGSQDEESRDKIIQAISAIRSDFARIIVVTHIAEVKEMFSTQIAVSKRDGSSQLSLIG